MSDRDELAAILRQNRKPWVTNTEHREMEEAQADAIIAWIEERDVPKPRMITTAPELDDLPERSVVLSGGVVPRIKAPDNRWLGEVIDVDSAHIIKWFEYATVLFSPDPTE